MRLGREYVLQVSGFRVKSTDSPKLTRNPIHRPLLKDSSLLESFLRAHVSANAGQAVPVSLRNIP